MTPDLDAARKRMTLLWFSVLSTPMLIGIAIALMVKLGNYSAAAEFLPADQLRMFALGAMGLMLICARPLRNLIMSPTGIAARPLQGTPSNSQDAAIGKTQASMFMLLGILDAVSMIVVAMSLMQADMQLALLNGVYTLVLAVVAKPDFAALLPAVQQNLPRNA